MDFIRVLACLYMTLRDRLR